VAIHFSSQLAGKSRAERARLLLGVTDELGSVIVDDKASLTDILTVTVGLIRDILILLEEEAERTEASTNATEDATLT
jgi:hypothetical protein